MPGTLDLDFIKVKRKTRSQPATPKGSPTRETGGDLISDSKNGSSKSVDKKTLRKSSDDGRYLFIKDRGDKLVSLQSHQSTPSSSPSTPVTNLAEPIAPRRSKSVRTFVELLGSQNPSALGDPSPPEKLKDQTGTRVSKVCVILNDAELLVESGGCRCEGFGGDVSDGIKEQLDLGSKEVSNCPQKTLALSMKDVSSDSDADFRDSRNVELLNGDDVSFVRSRVTFDSWRSCHEGRELNNQNFPVDVDTLFRWLFSNSKFFMEFHTARKTLDIVQSPWQMKSDGSKDKVREVSFTLTLTNSMTYRQSQVTENQLMSHESRPGEIYLIDVETNNSGIPYADSFSVLSHFCLSKVHERESKLCIISSIKYRKVVWGLVKALIEKNTWSGLEDFYGSLFRSLNTSANHIRWGVGIRSKKMKKQGLTESEGDYSPFEASSSIPTSTQGRFGFDYFVSEEFNGFSNTASRPNINKLIQKFHTSFSNGQQSKSGSWKGDSTKSCKTFKSVDEDSLELVESIRRKKRSTFIKSKVANAHFNGAFCGETLHHHSRPLSSTTGSLNSPSPVPSGFVNVILFLLSTLLVVNTILFYRLHTLEIRLESDNTAPFTNDGHLFIVPSDLPTDDEEWVRLLQRQAALHQIEIERWHDLLSTASSFLRQTEKSLSGLQKAVYPLALKRIRQSVFMQVQDTDSTTAKDSSQNHVNAPIS